MSALSRHLVKYVGDHALALKCAEVLTGIRGAERQWHACRCHGQPSKEAKHDNDRGKALAALARHTAAWVGAHSEQPHYRCAALTHSVCVPIALGTVEMRCGRSARPTSRLAAASCHSYLPLFLTQASTARTSSDTRFRRTWTCAHSPPSFACIGSSGAAFPPNILAIAGERGRAAISL